MRGFNRLLVFAALVGACSGSHQSDLFGAGGSPASEPPAESPSEEGEPTTAADGGTTAKDAGKKDAAATSKDSGAADQVAPAPARNPLEGASDLMKLSSSYGSLEGPIWRAGSKTLLFSDLAENSIERFAPPSTFSTFRYPSGGSNGLALDAQGQLVVCEGKNRRVTRTLAAGGTEIVADQFQGSKLNAPNDVIVRSDGTVYFTDPDYSINGYRELSFQGVFRVQPNGTIDLVADDLDKPNGIALSPDEKVLYVTDEKAGFIRAYDVAADGSTSSPRKLADAQHPDGIAIDDDGNVYAATAEGVLVIKPDGSTWGKIDVPKQPANCAFGGTSRRTLFITAGDSLYSIELAVPGPA